MLGQLVPCGGGQLVPLLKPKVVIGRKSFCDVVVPHPNVSSRHCEMEMKEGYWFVRDLGSTNGTRVDGKPMEEGYAPPGVEIAFATHRFTMEYTPASDQPPPEVGVQQSILRESLMQKAGIDVGAAVSSMSTGLPQGSPEAEVQNALGQLAPCGGGAPIPLTKLRMQIGRHGSCDIVLRFPTVSARHCELVLHDCYWFVNDLGSRNGVKVDGAPCQTACLKPGSTLSIAKLRYKVDYALLTDKPPPDAAKLSLAGSLLERAGLLRRDR